MFFFKILGGLGPFFFFFSVIMRVALKKEGGAVKKKAIKGTGTFPFFVERFFF